MDWTIRPIIPSQPICRTAINNTGVSGNFNTYNPIAQNLIINSLAYWRDTMGVDGFRFDLAAILGNTCQNRMLQLRQA